MTGWRARNESTPPSTACFRCSLSTPSSAAVGGVQVSEDAAHQPLSPPLLHFFMLVLSARVRGPLDSDFSFESCTAMRHTVRALGVLVAASVVVFGCGKPAGSGASG